MRQSPTRYLLWTNEAAVQEWVTYHWIAGQSATYSTPKDRLFSPNWRIEPVAENNIYIIIEYREFNVVHVRDFHSLCLVFLVLRDTPHTNKRERQIPTQLQFFQLQSCPAFKVQQYNYGTRIVNSYVNFIWFSTLSTRWNS